MPYADVGALRLYHETRGHGPRVLGINGTGWELAQPPNAFALPGAERLEMLSYDQRGQGRSDKPDIHYAMADYAEDAAGLLDAVGWARCGVIGISFGGMVAQELAVRQPARVERLVLACTSSGGAGGASYPLHELQDLPPEQYAERMLTLSDARRTPEWRAANPEAWRNLLDNATASRRRTLEDPVRRATSRRQLEARRRHDTWERLARLDMPVLICGGRHDGIARPENLEAMAGHIPNARLEFFEGGHLFLFEDPAAARAIVAFLRDGTA